MQLISDIQETRVLCQMWRDKGESIAFVPTMGCLHEGHLSLVEKAAALADHVVVSIFVNPLQFNDANDLVNYPIVLDEDVSKLKKFSVDMIFAPTADKFYPEGQSNVDKVEKIEPGEVSRVLEGAMRPGHFVGVATVVKRLFDLIQPNFAVFGEKDFQQLMIIQQLVKQYSLGIEIVPMPTFREYDGLAMSSRNIRLSKAERETAAVIYQNLLSVKTALTNGNKDYSSLEEEACENLTKAGLLPEYFVICQSGTLQVPQNHTDDKVILVAAKLGETRLIDNIRV